MFSQFFRRSIITLVVFATALTAHAQVGETAADAPARPHGVEQVLYKGVVGNLLDAVPLDPERRLELQRANAVASSVFSGRSLAVLLGAANPVFLIGGLAWGIWSATKIKAAPAMAQARADPHAIESASGHTNSKPMETNGLKPPVKVAVAASATLQAAD